jgi:hypothetical protein
MPIYWKRLWLKKVERRRNFMRAKRSLQLFFVVAVALFIMCTVTPPGAYAAAPNRLLIVRSPGISNNYDREMVNSALLVQQLYYHMLSLPPAPTHQICPLYIIAEYQLTFFHSRTSLLKADVLQGGCPTVTLSPGDKRATDGIFWSLLELASDFGVVNQHTTSTPAIMRAP